MNGLRRVRDPSAFAPQGGVVPTPAGRSHLQNPEGKIETMEVAELRSEKPISVAFETLSLLQTFRCDLSSGMRVLDFSGP